MSYVSQSMNNIPWERALLAINRTNVCILRILRIYPTTVQKVMESVLSEQNTGR